MKFKSILRPFLIRCAVTLIVFIGIAIGIGSSFDLSFLLYNLAFFLAHFIFIVIEHFIVELKRRKYQKFQNSRIRNKRFK